MVWVDPGLYSIVTYVVSWVADGHRTHNLAITLEALQQAKVRLLVLDKAADKDGGIVKVLWLAIDILLAKESALVGRQDLSAEVGVDELGG